MSKIGASLKPQVISAISKLPSATRSGWRTCRNLLHPATRPPHGEQLKSLEDEFVGLLIQAGSCPKRKTYQDRGTQERAATCRLGSRVQTRTITTASRRSGTAALAKTDTNDEDTQQSQEAYHAESVPSAGNSFADAIDTLSASSKKPPLRKSTRKRTDGVDELKRLNNTKAPPAAHDDSKRTKRVNSSPLRPFGMAATNSSSKTSEKTASPSTQDDSRSNIYSTIKNLKSSDLPPIRRSRYQELVDIYGMPIDEEATTNSHTPSLADWGSGLGGSLDSIVQYPLAPRLTISAEEEDRTDRRERQLREALTAQHTVILDELHVLLRESPGTVPQNRLWRLYLQLPSPQVYYLSFKDIDRLFQHLAWVEYKNFQGAKEKVFQLLNQCNAEGISVHRHHWTTAITFAGRWVRNIETEQVREAIETWMSMEQRGIRADPIVFNVLFDVAAKAGRFALADTIHSEMKARNLTINRYFRCSMIHCAGMRKDGDAVRAAFTDFVAEGDIVDTAVMNLVVRSLIRSGEGEAAEHVFSNMKSLHAEKFPGSNAVTWQERRALTKSLNRTVAMLRKKQQKHEASFFGSHYSNKDQLEEMQRLTPIHPDARTYRMIIGYHALVSGDIGRIQELLQEMRAEGFHVHGSVYVNIFWGFVRHGGYSFSAWTPDALERFWLDFAAAVPYANVIERVSPNPVEDQLDHSTDDSPTFEDIDHELSVMSEDNRPVHFSIIVAKNIMHAFYRCCGKRRMIKAWKDIQARWQTMSTEEEDILHAYCRKRLREHIWQESPHE